MTKHISDQVVQLCTSGQSVSSLLAKDPTLAPGDAWERLHGKHALKAAARRARSAKGKRKVEGDESEVERAARCGNWGSCQPSELFLRVGNFECRLVRDRS